MFYTINIFAVYINIVSIFAVVSKTNTYNNTNNMNRCNPKIEKSISLWVLVVLDTEIPI